MSHRTIRFRRMKWGFLPGALLASGLFCGWALSGDPTNEAADLLSRTQARARAYAEAWNSHDPDAVAAFYTNDADMMMGNSPMIGGRDAIRGWWATYFDHIDPRRRGSFQVDSVRRLSDDVVLVEVRTLTGGQDADGEELPARRARGTWVMIKRDGTWLIAALRGLPAEGEKRLEPGVDR